MLTVNHLNLQYGAKYLFRDIGVQVHAQDRIGLVGVNGAGKSTLLKIMAGIQETDTHVVKKASWFTVAYLPQEVTIDLEDRTLLAEAESAFNDILAWQRELDTVNTALATIQADSPRARELLNRQGELQHLLDGQDIFRIRPRIEQILAGLGFARQDLHRPVQQFSGGWLMRLLLAKLLLRQPSLLLLDEPTNHLDIDSLTWLETFLCQYKGAMVIISHDRSFLDRVTTCTWELSLGRLTIFKGNYSYYLQEKEQRLQQEKAAYANQQAAIRQAERFITRFRSKATKARQVQSRIKQLEKMERIELSASERTIHFSFPPALPSGRDLLTIQGLGKSFDDHLLFSDLNLSLQRGEKLGIVGVNGAGKSTFLKILAGIETGKGNICFGHNVVLSYFGQHQAQELSGELSVFDTVYQAATDMTMTQVRSLLGAFLFSGDDVDKKVNVLSGGEKSRVALARMLVRPANLLLLDEPTNHLDISSQQVLQEAMAQYQGAIIVVSHNRAFVNTFITRVLEIRDGQALLHEGNIDDYLRKRADTLEEEALQNQRPAPKEKDQASRREQRRQRAQYREELRKKTGPWKQQIKRAEAEIESLESRKSELEQVMADPELYNDQQRWTVISQEYSRLKRHLDRAYTRWEEAHIGLEAVEEEFRRNVSQAC